MCRLHTVQLDAQPGLDSDQRWLRNYPGKDGAAVSMDARREARCHRCGTRLAHDNGGCYCAPCQAGSRDRFAVPPDVPAEFWDSHAMRAASASRHMGRMIRAYRCHPFHGRRPLPQDVVAGWMGVTQGQLSRIENGPPIVHLDRLTHWARILGIPSSCLWFTLPEDDRAAAPGVHLVPAETGRSAPTALNDGDVSLWWAVRRGPAGDVSDRDRRRPRRHRSPVHRNRGPALTPDPARGRRELPGRDTPAPHRTRTS